ncbi:MAG: hypothetical protein H6751_00620 [Candidatus Omnitrophica bacterium]|nr:hypothetical protein [Candidatus Omnitrophota bacterium]
MSNPTGTSEKPNYKSTLCLLSKGEAEAIFPSAPTLCSANRKPLPFGRTEDL